MNPPSSATTAADHRSELGRRFDSLEQETYLSLWRTYDRLRALEDKLFDEFGLTAQQYNTLRLLAAHHPQGFRTLEIGSRLISRAPDITRLLEKLQRRGLIRRNRLKKNRRVVEAVITPAGLELLEQLAARVRACHSQQLGHLSEHELHQLNGLLALARNPHEAADSRWRAVSQE